LDFAAIILAAGFSSRMKAFKPLLPLGRSTIIDTAIDSFKRAGIENVLVVIGHRRDDLRRHLKGSDVTIVENPNFEQGMFTSVQAGADRLAEDCRAFFMLPVDIPLVRPLTVRLLKEGFEQTDPPLLSPNFKGRKGHPPLISCRLRQEILDAGESVTLRDILGRHLAESRQVEVPDRFIHMDADTPEAYNNLVTLADNWDVPNKDECEVIYQRLGSPNKGVKEHCCVVARLAVVITRALIEAGVDLNPELVRAASLLHDVAKDHENHGAVAAEWLNDWGFPRVARIVASHTDFAVSEDEKISESEIVYLADKMVQGVRMKSIGERYKDAIRKYGADPTVRQRIDQRWKRAEISRQRIESLLPAPIITYVASSNKGNLS
jgi:molybdenum cofactor cytidylyltransferase